MCQGYLAMVDLGPQGEVGYLMAPGNKALSIRGSQPPDLSYVLSATWIVG